MTLPSPRYLQHAPQYYPPEAAFPLAREPALPRTPAPPSLPPVPGPVEFMQLSTNPPNPSAAKPAGGIVVPTIGSAPERIPSIEDDEE